MEQAMAHRREDGAQMGSGAKRRSALSAAQGGLPRILRLLLDWVRGFLLATLRGRRERERGRAVSIGGRARNPLPHHCTVHKVLELWNIPLGRALFEGFACRHFAFPKNGHAPGLILPLIGKRCGDTLLIFTSITPLRAHRGCTRGLLLTASRSSAVVAVAAIGVLVMAQGAAGIKCLTNNKNDVTVDTH